MKKLLLTLILATLATPARAADPPTWNLISSTVDLHAPAGDDSGGSIAISYSSPLGTHRWLGYDIRIARDQSLGHLPNAWLIDADLLAVWTPSARTRLYAGGGLGGVWSGEVVTATDVDTPEGSVTVETSTSPAALAWNAALGVRLFFSPTTPFGLAVEHRRSGLASSAPIGDDTARTSLMLILPGGAK